MKEFTLSFAFVKHLFIISMLFATYSAAENKLQFQGGNFNVTWKHLSATQEIEFEVSVKTIGYVALGLTKTNSDMRNLDLFVGGVENSGSTYIKDYHANGESSPGQPESQQDYTLLGASESNGVTMVRCKRRLNTQDASDQLIQPGDSLYIAWAYHPSSDTLVYHLSRGYSSQMYVLVPAMTTPSPSPTTVGPTSSVTTSPTTNLATTSTTTESSTSSSSSLTSIPPISSTSTTTAATTTSTIKSPTTTLTTLEKTPTESIQTSSTTTTVQSSHTTTTTKTASTTTATVTISTNTNTQGVVQNNGSTTTTARPPSTTSGSKPPADYIATSSLVMTILSLTYTLIVH